MWRTQTTSKGRQVLNIVRRQLATETKSGAAPLPPPPPPPIPPARKTGGFGVFKFLGLTVPLASGGVIGYAWYDPEFRQQLESNVPYAKELLENILPDESKPLTVPQPPKQVIAPALDNISNNAFVAPPPVEKTQISEEKARAPRDKRDEMLTEKDLKTKNVKSKPDPSEVQAERRRKEEEEKADNAALEVVIHKVLTNSQRLTEEAVEAQKDVANTMYVHTKLLRQAMDDTSDILQKDAQWEAVAAAFKERENAVSKANQLVVDSKKSIEKLRDILSEGKSAAVTKNNPAIYPATKRVAELTKELNDANSKVRQAESEAKVMLKYKHLVDKGKKQFQQELESLFPDVKVGSSNRQLTTEELNALIAHAHRRIEQLQKQLAEQLALEQQRLLAALELQKKENVNITNVAVSEEKSRLANVFETEKQKLEMDFLVEQENEVRKQLARQAAAHSDHIKDVLALQMKELSQEYERDLNVKLLEEREKFQTEVSSWISRLKGIESAIDARAASEQLARCAQDLWLACISLNSSIHFGAENTSGVKPLQEEMTAVLKAGNKHPFVETVASAFPKEALDRGVYTEDALKERFEKVSRVCKQLGLLTDANRSLYRYFISYLHSFFTFDNVRALSEKDIINLDELDNFDLLAQAQYWMDRGNLEMALRFMNQLEGESKNAAMDWIREAKLLLETRQAASTLTAYASATGLANTF